MVIGHAEVVAALEAELPAVTLLLGPRSVGKWTLAEQAAEANDLSGVYLKRYARKKQQRPPDVLKVEHAREIIEFVGKRTPQRKGVIARLDGASDDAVNALLKVLEEPPRKTHFLLIAERCPYLTIMSRAQVLRCGYLEDPQVAEILVATDPKKRMTLARATGLALCAGGQIDRALEVARFEQNKGPVLSALKGAAAGDEELFTNAVSGKREIEVEGVPVRVDSFGDPQWRLLQTWAVEALTGRWRAFSPAESYGLQRDPRVAQRVLRLSGAGCRPRVAVRAALYPFVQEYGRSPHV